MEFKIENHFKNVPDRLLEEKQGRDLYAQTDLSYGCYALDCMTGGIAPHDLVVVTARSGAGKTELAIRIAETNALKGKRVHFFALEAEKGEIERRILFRMIAKSFSEKVDKKEMSSLDGYPKFQEWVFGRQPHLEQIEQEQIKIMEEKHKTLFTRYRNFDFTYEDFEREVLAVQNETDLIVVDHLHYFDLQDDNEVRGLKATIKAIRNVSIVIGKPVVLLAQLRKSDARAKKVIASMDDIAGTSDVSRIATRIITIVTPPQGGTYEKDVWPTLIRLNKNRLDGSRCRYSAITGFSLKDNAYIRHFVLGHINYDETSFEQLDISSYPYWAKQALYREQYAL